MSQSGSVSSPTVNKCGACGALTMMAMCPSCGSPTTAADGNKTLSSQSPQRRSVSQSSPKWSSSGFQHVSPPPSMAAAAANRTPARQQQRQQQSTAGMNGTIFSPESPGAAGSPNSGLDLVSPTTLRLEVERLNTVVRSKNGELANLQKAANTSVVSAATLHEMQELWRTVHFQQEDMERASDDLKVEYARLKDEYRGCCEERDKLKQKVGQQEKEHDGLVENSETQLASMRAEVRAMSAKLIDQSEAAASSKMKEEAALSKVDILTKDLRAARSEVEDAHASLKELTDAHLELQGRLNDEHIARKRRCDVLEAENASLQDRQNEMIRQRDEYRKQSDSDVRARMEGSDALHEAQLALGELRREKGDLNEKLVSMQTALDDRDAQIASLNNKIALLEDGLDSERVRRLDSSEDKILLAKLENEYNELRQFFETERSTKTAAVTRAVAAEEALGKLQKEHAALVATQDAMKEEVRTITLQKARESAEVEVSTSDMVTQLQELQDSNKTLRAESTKLNELLIAEQRATTDLQKRLNVAQADIARREREESEEKLTIVEAPLAAEQDARRAAEESNTIVTERLAATEKDKSQLASDLHNTKLELERVKSKVSLLQEECDEYYGNATSMENILDDLVAVVRPVVPLLPPSPNTRSPLISPAPTSTSPEATVSSISDEGKRQPAREEIQAETRKKEYCELPSAIAKLLMEIRQLEDAHEAAAAQESQLIETQHELEDVISNAEAAAKRLHQELESVSEDKALLEQQMVEVDAAHTASISKKDDQIRDLEGKVKNTALLDERVESLRRQLEAETKRAEIAEESVAGERTHAASEVAGLEARMRHAESDRDALIERVHALEDEVDALTSPPLPQTHDRAISPIMPSRSERAVSPMVRSPSPRSRMEKDELLADADRAKAELAEIRRVAQTRIADLHALLAAEKQEKQRVLHQMDELDGRMRAEQSAHLDLKHRVDEMSLHHHYSAPPPPQQPDYTPQQSPAQYRNAYQPTPPGNPIPADVRGQNEELLRQIEEQKRLLNRSAGGGGGGFQYGMATPSSTNGSVSGSHHLGGSNRSGSNIPQSRGGGRSATFGGDAHTRSLAENESVSSRNRSKKW